MKTLTSFLLLILALSTSCSSTKTMGSVSSGGGGSTITSEEGVKGLSYETAIKVNSIDEEYKWVQANYPGARVVSQALVNKKGVPHDLLTFNLPGGGQKTAYFDISSFFGKF